MKPMKILSRTKKLGLSILFVIISLHTYANKDIPDSLHQYVQYAIKIMDDGQYDESMKILEFVLKKSPKFHTARYELGLAHYYKKDYKKTIKELKKVVNQPSVGDMGFQLLGNAYDMDNQPKKAIETYSKGLQKHPSSGRLYLERGLVFQKQEQYDKAIYNYEKGIDVDPLYPSNYFRAANVFCNSREKVFGIMYGEIMINMQPDTERAKSMSRLIYETYKKGIIFTSDSITNISLTKNNSIDYLKKEDIISIPFEVIYETAFALSIQPLLSSKKVNLTNMHQCRTLMVDVILKQYKITQNLLFNYHKKIIDAGHFEAYNMWLLSEGAPGEFNIWANDNEQEYISFLKWHKENPLIISIENRFSRETAPVRTISTE